jgi:dihydropyrimidinase
MDFDLVIQGGTVITASETWSADIGLQGEKIAAIGQDLIGKRTINATGLFVIPGGIDAHVHLQIEAGQTFSSDDWETGSVAAACGGTTTLIDFIEPDLGASLLPALGSRRSQADGHSVIDYGLHMTIRQSAPKTLAEIPELVLAGCPSFKTYTTYDGFRLEDGDLFKVFQAVKEAGGIALVHAENHAMIEALKSTFLQRGDTDPCFHPRSRPEAAEEEAIERVICLAEITGCPLYIVHVSTQRGAEAIVRARARGQTVFGETCPQYLLLSDKEYERPGFEGAKFVCSPPLRPKNNVPALWAGLANHGLSTLSTDHCPFFYAGQKDLGRQAFTEIPNGLPGVESRLALAYTYGVGDRQFSINRWVEICCTAPAKIFGLYPQKGTLAPGADADIVLFDPKVEITLHQEHLHEHIDYTPYEGLRLKGYPSVTISRGEIIYQNGEFTGSPGRGKFLFRQPFNP